MEHNVKKEDFNPKTLRNSLIASLWKRLDDEDDQGCQMIFTKIV